MTMPKITLLFFLLTVSIHLQSNNHPAKKLVIGYPPLFGMFAALCGTINVLASCEQQGKIPVIYWGPGDATNAPYYQQEGYNGSTNAWEYYFEPVSEEKYVQGDPITYCMYVSGDNLLPAALSDVPSWDHRAFRKKVKPYVDRYLQVKPDLMKKIDAFYDVQIKGKPTIALHLRGTDKIKELQPVSAEDMCSIANEYAEKLSGCQFFVCTDELSLLNRARELLHGKVITYNSYRSIDGKPLHLNHSHGQSPAKIGEDIIIEVLLMSRCDLLVHTWSNVALGAMYFNATLDTVLVLPPRTLMPSCTNWPS